MGNCLILHFNKIRVLSCQVMQMWRPAAQRVVILAPQQQRLYRIMPVEVDGATGLPCFEPGESLFVLGVSTPQLEPSPAPVPAKWLPGAAFSQPAPRINFGPVATSAPQYARAVPWHAEDLHADPLRQFVLVGGSQPQVNFAADMLPRNDALACSNFITANTYASCSRFVPGEYSAEPAHFMSMPRAAAGSAGRHEGFTR